MTGVALARHSCHSRSEGVANNSEKSKAKEPLKPGSPEWMRRHYADLAMQSYALGDLEFRDMFEKPATPVEHHPRRSDAEEAKGLGISVDELLARRREKLNQNKPPLIPGIR
jgi:hypothetical protein